MYIEATHLENANEGISIGPHICECPAEFCSLKWDERDDKIVLVARNIEEDVDHCIRIYEGNGIAGMNSEKNLTLDGEKVESCDGRSVEINVAPGEACAIALESSRFKWVSGPAKGTVIVAPEDGLTLCAITLP